MLKKNGMWTYCTAIPRSWWVVGLVLLRINSKNRCQLVDVIFNPVTLLTAAKMFFGKV